MNPTSMSVLVDTTVGDATSSSADVVAEQDVACMLLRRPVAMHSFCPQRRALPRRAPASNPVIAELMNTVAQARDRKRQREEAMFNRRDVGQQTAWDADDETEETVGGGGISAAKRIRREEPSSSDPTTTAPPHETVSIGTNTNTTSTPSIPESSAPSSSTPSVVQPSTSTTARLRRAQRSRRPNNSHAHEVLRIHMENTHQYLQQIAGVVPSDHVCDVRCPHHQQAAPAPQVAPPPPPVHHHAVSPTLAPFGHHLRTPLTAFPYYPLPMMAPAPPPPPPPAPAAPIHVPVMMGLMVPLPVTTATPFSNLYALRSAPWSTITSNTEHIASLLRLHHELMFPHMDRFGLDRHHMFAGLDIDVPVGATRTEIDNCTKSDAYKKPEEEEEEETCTVCLSGYEEGENIRRLPCNHFFHPTCIDKWLDINKRCPMCREEIDRPRV